MLDIFGPSLRISTHIKLLLMYLYFDNFSKITKFIADKIYTSNIQVVPKLTQFQKLRVQPVVTRGLWGQGFWVKSCPVPREIRVKQNSTKNWLTKKSITNPFLTNGVSRP